VSAAVGKSVILIPGFMGSRLSEPGRHAGVWLDPVWNLTNAAETIALLTLQSPDDNRLDADGILERVPLGPFSPHVYAGFLAFLADGDSGLGYGSANVRSFCYDWRKPINAAAAELDALIGRWAAAFPDPEPIVLIAHSYGCLVATHALLTGRYAPAKVAMLIAIGGPFSGLVKTLAVPERGRARRAPTCRGRASEHPSRMACLLRPHAVPAWNRSPL